MNMELQLDFESPEQRVLSWLTDSVSSGSNSRYSDESGDSAKSRVEENELVGPRKCSSRVKTGLKKYFICDDSDLSSVSESESFKATKNNRLYCDVERRIILQYIIDKKLFPFLKGNTIWKLMEKERICDRSWQSMKTQFLRYIYPNLEDFGLPQSAKTCFVNCMERSPQKKSSRASLPIQHSWRQKRNVYTFAEDIAIMYYVIGKNRCVGICGNALWIRMESKNIIPNRSWHSLKSRYKCYLSRYVEKYVAKLDGKTGRTRFNAVEKVILLQNFVLDHLIDMAVAVGLMDESGDLMKKLKTLGLDCTFSIPLPGYHPRISEGDDIKVCVDDIFDQLADKFNELSYNILDNREEMKEILCIIPPKFACITDLLKKKMTLSQFDNKNSCNQSANVKEELTTFNSQKYKRKHFFMNPEENIKKPCTLVNSDTSPTCSSSLKYNCPESNIFVKDSNLSEKLMCDAMHTQTNEDSQKIIEDILKEIVHFKSSEAIRENIQYSKIPKESLIVLRSQFKSILERLSKETECVTTCTEESHKDKEKVEISVHVTRGTSTSHVDVSEDHSEKKLQGLEIQVGESMNQPNVDASDCVFNPENKINNETKIDNMDVVNLNSRESHDIVQHDDNIDEQTCVPGPFEFTGHSLKNIDETNSTVESRSSLCAIENEKYNSENILNIASSNYDNNDKTTESLNPDAELNLENCFDNSNINNAVQASTSFECASESERNLEVDDDAKSHLSILEYIMSPESQTSDIFGNSQTNHVSDSVPEHSPVSFGVNRVREEEEAETGPSKVRLTDESDEGC